MDRKSRHKHKKPRLCLVSSSGGHWEQLQKLQPLIDKYDGFMVTEKTQFQENAKYFMMQTDLKDRFMPFKMAINSLRSLAIWIKERPDFVITTGALCSYPVCIIAKKIFKSKIIYIESFARCDTVSLTGKLMIKHADLFIVQWKEMLKLLPKAVYGGGIF